MRARGLIVVLLLTTHWAMADEPEPRVITVSGVGEVKAVPDRATVQLGVEARRLELEAARAEVTKGVSAFLDYCEELDIAAEKIATSGITIRPEYSWNNNVRRLTGYFVGRSLVVDLADLDKLGKLIEGAVDQGVNQVSEPVFGLKDRGRYEREAMTLAATDAQRNAATLASALGVTVGDVISISAQSSGPPPPPRPMMTTRMAEADMGGTETYRSGEITFQVQVQARFAIAGD
jgi:uncharacterized protein YggE